jgi:hypothetical protein
MIKEKWNVEEQDSRARCDGGADRCGMGQLCASGASIDIGAGLVA